MSRDVRDWTPHFIGGEWYASCTDHYDAAPASAWSHGTGAPGCFSDDIIGPYDNEKAALAACRRECERECEIEADAREVAS